jgi:hypothetical protein
MKQKGKVYRMIYQPDNLVKVTESAINTMTGQEIVIFRPVNLDIGFHSDGSFNLGFEYIGSQVSCVESGFFIHQYEEFELDRTTILRLREGLNG